METDNETVDQVCEYIYELVIAIHDKEHNGKQDIKNVWHIVQQVKDRIIDAHKREIGELKGERAGILKANASLAADNDRLRELVKEMADELSKFHAWEEARALVAKASEVIRKDKTNDTY